jgi:uncharacterized alkaline shock family protein YloU
MDEQLNVDGLTIAPGVVETILNLAISQIDGVAVIGASRISEGVISAFNKRHNPQGITVTNEDGKAVVEVHVQVYYGFRLPDLAGQIRSVIADALKSQVGIDVAAVNVFIDGIQFME